MHAKIFHQSSWALTSLGTPIELYKKVHTPPLATSTEKPLLFIGGMHGDEPEGVRLAEDFLQWLKQEQSENLRPWILIPCINPDGYRKNQRMNANGVDLNRNFPSQDWTSAAKSERYFPGPKAGSEREVQALVQLIEDEKPQLIVHFHSWEPCVVYSGKAGRRAAEILGAGTGYEVREDIGYPTPGSLGRYGPSEKNIPVLCIEAQEKVDLHTVWPKFASGLQKIVSKKTELF